MLNFLGFFSNIFEIYGFFYQNVENFWFFFNKIRKIFGFFQQNVEIFCDYLILNNFFVKIWYKFSLILIESNSLQITKQKSTSKFRFPSPPNI